jgi:hypothetical protein
MRDLIGPVSAIDAPNEYDQGGSRTEPTINRYVGTQAVFQDSIVAPQTAHSKLAIWRFGAMASVRL